MKSIRGRLVGSHLIIILLTVTVFSCILVFLLRQYYYGDVETILNEQVEFAVNSYGNYADEKDLEKNAKKLLDNIYVNTYAQVQIIDNEGKILADSEESGLVGTTANYPDVQNAIKNKKKAKWIGKVSMTYERVLSISQPIIVKKDSDTDIKGIIRLTSTLSEIDSIILKMVLFFVLIGIVVVLFVLIVSFFLSGTIIKPVKEITNAAEEIALGRLDIRVPKRYDDEVGKLAVTLNHMAKEISNHQKLKDDFIASISHELRTPLTSIKGWASTLNSSDFSNMDEFREGLEIIENETDRLALLVNELLDFSKLESKSTSLGIEALDVDEFLSEIRNQMNPRAQRQGIVLELEVEDDLPLIKADRNRLKQVMINILDNSLKYTQEGGRIKISAQSKKEEILISVEDTGIGIPEDDLHKVKEKFYKVSTSYSGNGLGLAICDEIVRLHNGRMEISSIFGKGTRVDVFMP
ncbi:MAG: HAMP domain-containing histidine kinase [Clostridiaceae bacterium]|nr:HAMP domain-containing histidine kinase [Clostridiaceae bacterium]